MVRTFLAIELPSDVREAIVQQQRELQGQLPSASWVRSHGLHITLKFLGDTPDDQIEPIRDSVTLKLKDMRSFAIELYGFGVFPHSKAPRIFWTGVTSGNEQLLAVSNNIEDALNPLGFPKEGKPFHPHVTLARIKNDQKRFGQALHQKEILTHSMRFGSVPVEGVALVKSDLRPTGSVYTQLWEVPFQKV